TIASAVPLALGLGPGAETRAPLARSIIGGIVLSTLVTLVIVPIFYVLFDRFGHWVSSLTQRDDEAKPKRGEHPGLRTIRLRKPTADLLGEGEEEEVPTGLPQQETPVLRLNVSPETTS